MPFQVDNSLLPDGKTCTRVGGKLHVPPDLGLMNDVAANAYAASAAQNNYDSTFFDIFRDEAKISDKGKCIVITLESSNEGLVDCGAENVLEDFEDGTTGIFYGGVASTDWSSSGSYSLKLSASDSKESASAYSWGKSTHKSISFACMLSTQTGNQGDHLGLRFQGPNNDDILVIEFVGSGEIVVNYSVTLSATWSANTEIDVTIDNIDYLNHTFDLYVDGVEQLADQSFENPDSYCDYIFYYNDSSSSGSAVDTYLDNIVLNKGVSQTTFTTTATELPFVPKKTMLESVRENVSNGQTITFHLQDGDGNTAELSEGETGFDNFTSSTVHLNVTLDLGGASALPRLHEYGVYFV